MKYYYPDTTDIKNLNLDCTPRNFPNINNTQFTNADMLNFIDEKYNKPFEKSPFTFPEDYINETYDTLCSSSSYSLKPQQKFIGQLINPNSNIKNILIYHGLGSGKTCTSLLIGEAFANIENKETLYVVPAALEQQYIDEIIGEIKGKSIQSCTSMCLVYDNTENKYLRSIYTSVDNKRLLDGSKNQLEILYAKKSNIYNQLRRVNKKADEIKLNKELTLVFNKIKTLETNIKIKEDQTLLKVDKVFTITTHEKFINRLMKITESKQVILKEYLQPGSSLFKNNTTLIIDEIQNLISAGGVRYKILYNSIKYYFNPNVRKVFLSATPIYDNAFELALTINLLQPRIPFPTVPDLFYNMFVGKIIEKDDKLICKQRDVKEKLDYFNACLINKELFKYMCAGYVSYFKGGNPIAYPYKRIIELYHPMEDEHKAHYIASLRKDVIQDLFRTLDKLNKSGTSSKKDIEGIITNEYSELEASGTLTHARQGINISFPQSLIFSDAEELNMSNLTETEKTKLVIEQNKELLKKSLMGETTDEIMSKLSSISPKIKSILDISLSVEGTIFIYSNWLGYGVEAISTVLDTLGYSRFPKVGNPYKSYFIWSPSVESDKNIIKKARLTFNSPDNKDGKMIKFILGTASIKEGVSFKNVAQIHLLDPWWNNSRIAQIEARGVRLCSHVDLPPDKRHVDIFRHVGVLSNFFDYSDEEDSNISDMFNDIYTQFMSKKPTKRDIPSNIDPAVRRLLLKDDKNLLRQALNIVFNSLKWTRYISIDQKIVTTANDKSSLNTKFEKELKSVGIDCELFKNGNLIRIEENIKQISKHEYQLYFRNPSNNENYLREGVPILLSFNDIMSRRYSYPNSKDLSLKFNFTSFDGIKFNKDETKVITVPNNDLVINEDITCWKTPLSFEDIPVTDPKFKEYTTQKANTTSLLNDIRIHFLGQINDSINEGIKFSSDDRLKRLRIINCYNRILKDEKLDKTTRLKMGKYTQLFKLIQDLDKKIITIATKLGMTSKADIENLYELAIKNPGAIESQYKYVS